MTINKGKATWGTLGGQWDLVLFPLELEGGAGWVCDWREGLGIVCAQLGRKLEAEGVSDPVVRLTYCGRGLSPDCF